MGAATRNITLQEIKPDCRILINHQLYDLRDFCKGKSVLDIGCGYGKNKEIVELAGGKWTGIDPYPEEGRPDILVGFAESLPVESGSIDIVIMDAVLEHVFDPSICFKEISRVLKPKGKFIGYVAFMECFHEISYCHLSFKALEHFAEVNQMKLEGLSGGSRFGIDYHFQVLLYPIPSRLLIRLISSLIRGFIRLKSFLLRFALKVVRKENREVAKNKAELYYKIECLRQSVGFNFIIEKQ